MNLRRALLAVFATISTSQLHAAPEAPATKLGLREAVQMALQQSPVLDSARKTETTRELERKNANAKFLPQLNLSATHGVQGDDSPRDPYFNYNFSNPTEPWTSSLSLGLTENFYDNGVTITNAEIAKINLEAAKESRKRARDNLILEVHREFYDYSLAVALLSVREQQLGILEKQFRTVRNQYTQGFKTRSEFLRFRSDVLRAELDKLSAEKTIEVSMERLRRLMGVDSRTTKISFDPISANRERIKVPTAAPDVEQTYEVRIARFQERVSEKNIDLANRNYWPRLFLTSNVSYLNSNYVNSGQPFNETGRIGWDALIKIEYSLLDWGQSRRDVEIARLARSIESNTSREALLETQTQIAQLMADLDRASKSYQTDQELLSLEEETFESLERQYREGKVSYLDLTEARNSFLDARTRFFTSYFETLRSLAQYRYLEGKISDGFDAE